MANNLQFSGQFNLEMGKVNVDAGKKAAAELEQAFQKTAKGIDNVAERLQKIGQTKPLGSLLNDGEASSQSFRKAAQDADVFSKALRSAQGSALAYNRVMQATVDANTSLMARLKAGAVDLSGALISAGKSPRDYLQSVQASMAARLTGVWAAIRYAKQASTAMEETDLLRASLSRVLGGQQEANTVFQYGMKVASAYSVSLSDVTKAMTEMARQGRSIESIKYLTSTLAETRLLLATSTGEFMSMASAMDHVTTLMNQLDISAIEAARGIKIMAEMDIRTATNFDKIGEALQKFAATGKVAGMSLNELIMAATAFTEVGFSGEQAGTALNTILSRIGRNTESLAFMRDLGVTMTEMQGSTVKVNSSMEMLAQTYTKLKDQGNFSGLREFLELYAGTRMQSKLVAGIEAYIRQQDNYSEYIKAATSSDAATLAERDRALSVMLNTITAKKTDLKNAFERMFLTDDFVDLYKTGLEAAKSIALTFSTITTGSAQGLLGMIGLGDAKQGLESLAALFQLYLIYKIPTTIATGVKYIAANMLRVAEDLGTGWDTYFKRSPLEDAQMWNGATMPGKLTGLRMLTENYKIATQNLNQLVNTFTAAAVPVDTLAKKAATALAAVKEAQTPVKTPKISAATLSPAVGASVDTIASELSQNILQLELAKKKAGELERAIKRVSIKGIAPDTDIVKQWQETLVSVTEYGEAVKALQKDFSVAKKQGVAAMAAIETAGKRALPAMTKDSVKNLEALQKVLAEYKTQLDTLQTAAPSAKTGEILPDLEVTFRKRLLEAREAIKTTGQEIGKALAQGIELDPTMIEAQLRPVQEAVNRVFTLDGVRVRDAIKGVLPIFDTWVSDVDKAIAQVDSMLNSWRVRGTGSPLEVQLQSDKRALEGYRQALMQNKQAMIDYGNTAGASVSAVSQKMQELEKHHQAVQASAVQAGAAMKGAFSSVTNIVVGLGSKLLNLIAILSNIAAAVGVVVLGVKALDDWWTKVLSKAKEHQEIREQIEQRSQKVDTAEQEVGKSNDMLSGLLTQVYSSVAGLIKAIGYRSAELGAEGAMSPQYAKLESALANINGSLMITEQAFGLLSTRLREGDGAMQQLAQKMLEAGTITDSQRSAIAAWATEVSQSGFKVERAWESFAQNVLQWGPEVVSTLKAIKDPAIQAVVESLQAPLATLASELGKAKSIDMGKLIDEPSIRESYKAVQNLTSAQLGAVDATKQYKEVVAQALPAFQSITNQASRWQFLVKTAGELAGVSPKEAKVKLANEQIFADAIAEGKFSWATEDARIVTAMADQLRNVDGPARQQAIQQLLTLTSVSQQGDQSIVAAIAALGNIFPPLFDAFGARINSVQTAVQSLGRTFGFGVGAEGAGILDKLKLAKAGKDLEVSIQRLRDQAKAPVINKSEENARKVEVQVAQERYNALKEQIQDKEADYITQRLRKNDPWTSAQKLWADNPKERVKMQRGIMQQISRIDGTIKSLRDKVVGGTATSEDRAALQELRGIRQGLQSTYISMVGAKPSPEPKTPRAPKPKAIEKDLLQEQKNIFAERKALLEEEFMMRKNQEGKILDMQDRTKTPAYFAKLAVEIDRYIKALEKLVGRGDAKFQSSVNKSIAEAKRDKAVALFKEQEAKDNVVSRATLHRVEILNEKLRETSDILSDIDRKKIYVDISTSLVDQLQRDIKYAGALPAQMQAIDTFIAKWKQMEEVAQPGELDLVYKTLVNELDTMIQQWSRMEGVTEAELEVLMKLRDVLKETSRETSKINTEKLKMRISAEVDTKQYDDFVSKLKLQQNLKVGVGGSPESQLNNIWQGIVKDTVSALSDPKIKEGIKDGSIKPDDLEGIIRKSLDRIDGYLDTIANNTEGIAGESSGGWLPPTLSDIENKAQELKSTLQSRINSLVDELASAMNIDANSPAYEKLKQMAQEKVQKMDQALLEGMKKAHDAYIEMLNQWWDEGFNIGFEYGFTEKGYKALKDMLLRNIATQISKFLQKTITEALMEGLAAAFKNIKIPGIGGGFAQLIGGLVGGVISAVIGFFIGGLFNQLRDQSDELAEQQRKSQKDRVTSSGFDWTYKDSEKATPYYEFSPPITQESVKIVKFINNFSITTDAALAMISSQRELRRVIEEIITQTNRSMAKTTGLKV